MYEAYLNNNLFLDTTYDDDGYTVTDAILIKEKGGAGKFTFVVPSDNVCYGQFRQLKDYVDLYQDDTLIFFGRVYSTNQRFDNSVEVVCEGMLAVLTDSIFEPITHDGTLFSLVTKLLASHNSQVENEKKIYLGSMYIQDAACYRAYENYENTWKRFEDLVQSFGGFLKLYRYDGKMYLDWKASCDDGSTQRIDFGENLLDFQKYHSLDKLCTVFIPLGKADEDNVRLDISSVNQGSKRLYSDSEYIQKYGYIVKSAVWDDVTVASILKTKGQNYLESCLAEQYTVTVTAVDLADAGYDINHFQVGQSILVTSKPNGIDGVFFDVNSQTLNLFHPESNRLSLGTEMVGYVKLRTQSLDDLNRRLELKYPTNSAMALAVESATRLITGNKGGYVVLHDSNSDTFPDEILIMDTQDIATARKVWRWNKSGLGYSNTGYNGNFGLAMTIDGSIVADYITTGHLSGERITAGTITADQIAARTITAIEIKSGAITANEIAARTITAGKIAVGAITANEIEARTITASEIATGTITANEIAANAITTAKLSANAVTADKIDVTDLFSKNITASNFNISGGSIRITTSASLSDVIDLSYDNGTYHYNACINSTGFLSKEKRNGWTSSYGHHNVSCWRSSNLVYDMEYENGGRLRLCNSSGTATITCKGSNGTITTTGNISGGSDIRLKDDIETLDYSKSEKFIYGLKPVLFRWKADTNGKHHGFLAQDVESLIQDVYGNNVWKLVGEIDIDDKGSVQYKTLSYLELLADIVATVQIHNKRITALEKAI